MDSCVSPCRDAAASSLRGSHSPVSTLSLRTRRTRPPAPEPPRLDDRCRSQAKFVRSFGISELIQDRNAFDGGRQQSAVHRRGLPPRRPAEHQTASARVRLLGPTPRAEARARSQSLDAAILRHTSLVRRIAYRLCRSAPGYIEVDDLIQAGTVGLLEAVQRYRAECGASFETYACVRIRGAIVDHLRKRDWRPRVLHRRLRDIQDAKRRIENATGGATQSSRVAAALGVSLSVYDRTLRDAATTDLLSIDQHVTEHGEALRDVVVDDSPTAADEIERNDIRNAVTAAINALPDNERNVIFMHYNEGLLLRQIGERLDLTESRICQLHSRAVTRLRENVRHWMHNGRLAKYSAMERHS
jgi:RNA polymerase sigma factor for flagellar operon FliA